MAQYKSLLANVKTFIQDAGYNGKTLIGNITGSSGTLLGGQRGAQRDRRHVRHRHLQRFGAV